MKKNLEISNFSLVFGKKAAKSLNGNNGLNT